MDGDCNIAILADTGEEENNTEKESEIKFDEKDLFMTSMPFPNNLAQQKNGLEITGYLLLNSDFKEDILLPPPELFLI